MSSSSKQIGARLRSLRNSRGLTQADVAERLGVSRSTVAQMETGRRSVRGDEIAVLCTLYGIGASEIVGPGLADGDGTPLPAIIDDVIETIGEGDKGGALRRDLESTISLAQSLVTVENALGLDAISRPSAGYTTAEPPTAWEAAQQGYRAAEDERMRLGLGDAPVRHVDELLGSLRIRAARVELSPDTASLSIRHPDIGDLVVVNGGNDLGRRRFSYAHGLAHALFDRGEGWRRCRSEDDPGLAEIRANAFGSAFLLPEQGARRFLESLGKEPLGRGGAVVLEMATAAGAVDGDAGSVTVDGRGRRGRQPINLCDLARLARYFGVSRSLTALRLRNLRLVTESQLDALRQLGQAEEPRSGQETLILDRTPYRGDSLRSRVAVLVAEACSLGRIERERFEECMTMAGVDDQDRQRLLALTSS